MAHFKVDAVARVNDGAHAQQHTSVAVLNGLRHHVVGGAAKHAAVGGDALAGDGGHFLAHVDAGRLAVAGHDFWVGDDPGVAVAGKRSNGQLAQGVATQQGIDGKAGAAGLGAVGGATEAKRLGARAQLVELPAEAQAVVVGQRDFGHENVDQG